MAQPNDWGKQVKASTASGEGSEKGLKYWEFWEQFLATVHANHPTWTRARTATRNSWLDLSLGSGAAVLASTFTRRSLSAWIYFGSMDESANGARFEQLRQVHPQFESVLNEPAVWDEMAGKKAARVGVESDYSSVMEVERWSEMITWLVDAHQRLRAALQAVGGVDDAHLKVPRPAY